MEGKIFLYSNGTPSRIAIPDDAFVFDLQRFVTSVRTLEELKNKCTESGGVYTLNDDITLASGKTISINENFTLNLNGHTIKGASGNYTAFTVKDGYNFTVQDTSTDADGQIISSVASKNSAAVSDVKATISVESGGTLNIQSGVITNSKKGAYRSIYSAGTVNISGGTVSTGVTNNGTSFNVSSGSVTGAIINNGTFTQSGGTTAAVTNNGTFNKTDGSNTGTITNNADATFTQSGGTTVAVTNNGTFTKTNGENGAITNNASFEQSGGSAAAITNNNAAAQATISGGTVSGAVKNSKSGAQLTISGSASINGTITNNAGATFTQSGGSTAAVNNSGTLNVNSGTVSKTINNYAGATFTQSGGSTAAVNNSGTFTKTDGDNGAITNNATGIFTQENGTITSLTNKVDGAKATISGGSVTGNISNAAKTDLTISGDTTITGTLKNYGTFTKEGGTNNGTITNYAGATFTQSGGSTAAVTNSGTFTKTDGSNTGAITNNANATFEQSGGTTTNTVTNKAGATFTKTGGYNNNHYVSNAGTLNMSGGSAWVDNSGTFNMSNGTAGDIRNSGDCSITGGILNTDQFEYVADGVDFVVLDGKVYVGEQASKVNIEGKYKATVDGITKFYTKEADATAAESNVVASIGDVKYSSLQKAVTASKSGDTIEMLRDVELDSGWINIQQKEITLDLKGKNISTNSTAVFTVMPKSALGATNTKTANIPATSLTINNTGGDNSGQNGSIISNSTAANGAWTIVVVGDGNESHAPSLVVNGGYIGGQCGVSGIGNVPSDETNPNLRDDRYINITINDGNITGTDSTGIYFPGMGNLKINGGEIEGTSGIEIRAGSLEVTGGKITATGTEYNSVGNRSGSTSSGVGIAIAQHTTKKPIELKISGEPEISGTVALGVANPQGNDGESGEIEVNIDGGTFTSKGEGEAAISAQNSDERVSININSGTFNGDLKSTFATTSDGKSVGIKITGEVTVTDSEGNTNKYDANSLQYVLKDGSYKTVAEGWNAVNNEWIYFVRESKGSVAAKEIASLTPATEAEDETTLKLTIKERFGDTVELDFNSDLFKGAKYTTVDASSLTADYPLKITAGDVINNIIGGAGNDTLTASSLGAVLNGSAGDNSLIGGASADTFIHTAGTAADETAGTTAAPIRDTIDNYDIANDTVIVTNELPTDLATSIKYDSSSSEFVFSLGGGAGDSLTFHSASEVKLTYKPEDATENIEYYYRPDHVIKNNAEATLGAAFSESTFNARILSSDYVDYSSVATIDASAVESAVNITGAESVKNSIKGAAGGGVITGGDENDILEAGRGNTTLNGGAGDDSLKGGNGADVFIYDGNAGGTDTISGYDTGDLVNVRNFKLSEAAFTADGNNISLNFGGNGNLIFEDVEGKTISVRSGSSSYIYNKNYYAHNKGVTLAADYTGPFDGTSDDFKDYATINAAAVDAAISVMGNSLGNYIFGSSKGGTLNGGAGNDKLNVSERGDSAKYLFEFTEGKDEVFGFNQSSDTVSIAVADITAAKASTNKLTLTIDKSNSFALNSDDDITKVSLAGSGTGPDYLTKDGYVDGDGFSLFGSAKGRIDLNDDLYKASTIKSVAADSVKSQSVTLVGGSQGGTFTYYKDNKQRDGFVYGGGSATVVNYEAGRDRIDLNAASLTSFAVTNEDVALTTNSGVISITGAAGQEVLLHDANQSRAYKKMVFVSDGVLQNKAKNPTMATVSTGATSYSAADDGKTSIKKIYVTDIAQAVKVQAGDKNNTVIDASEAAQAVSLSGGAKNDKLIGSAHKDTFIYTAGKDVIQGFGTGDSISLSDDLYDDIGSAKITAGSKSIKFKFSNKNTLTIKATKGETLSGALNINGGEQTYVKNAIAKDGAVTLTSSFSGTFKTVGTKGLDTVSTVNGDAVSKNLTYKGSEVAETLTGGSKKTTFKGGGGADSLVGGTGKDTFFYAKGDEGNANIANFTFGTDKIKVASGIINNITTADNAVTFGMTKGKSTDAVVGSFVVEKESTQNVAIRANNTYYWFATQNDVDSYESTSGEAITLNQLITKESRVSAGDVSGLSVLDLNYATNLAKSGVAVKVTTKSNNNA